MSRVHTYNQALNKLAQYTYANRKSIEQQNKQRRTQVTDSFGREYTRVGDGGAPATFYISIEDDLEYWERFQFKLIIQPFLSTAGSGTSETTVTINPTSLSGSGGGGSAVVSGENLILTNGGSGGSISPNPHTHTSEPHTHGISPGITLVPVTASDFRVKVEGIDITAYLMAQFGGQWISGEGIYPTSTDLSAYDVLEVASVMTAEGKSSEASTLLSPGYKKVEITSASPFQVTLVNYLKYSHINR